MNRFERVIADIYHNFPASRKSDCTTLKSLLEKLNNPQQLMPPAIHIVGTNGKGSTQAFLKACLSAAGYRVHTYTSPHLVHFTERINIAGSNISERQFLYYYEHVINFPEVNYITWFELITIIAFTGCQDHPADITLIEAGIGGRLDATNLLENIICTVISAISMDHQQQLGKSLTAITMEKADVIRTYIPVITSKQQPEVLNAIQYQAQLQNSPLYIQDISWHCYSHENFLYFNYNNKYHTYTLPNLIGAHQIQNAGLALATLMIINDRFTCTPQAINEGLSHCQWPGRLQKINAMLPIFSSNPHNIYLDCAHNEGGIRVLMDFMKEQQIKPLIIIGILKRRSMDDLIQPLRDHIAGIIGIPISNEDSYSAHEIEVCAASFGISSVSATSYKDALKIAMTWLMPFKDIIICGSIYLIGDILRDNKYCI